MASNHRWKFFRAGGVDQVALRDGRDILQVGELDPKLWVALAMPAKGVEVNPRTLDLLDTDHDGRLRVPEIIEAVKFVEATFESPDDVVKGGDGVALTALRDPKVRAAARRVLDTLGKKDAVLVILADVEEHDKTVAKRALNGDGVVPPGSVEDEEARKVVAEILDTVGGVADLGGEKGINQAGVDAFFAQARALVEWTAKAEADKSLFVAGPGTGAAFDAVRAVRAKVDDFFTRCRLAAFDARGAAALNGADADFAALAGKQLSAAEPDVARLPIARVEGGRALPLKDGLNPAWSAAVAQLATAAVGPLVKPGATQLGEAEWTALLGKLAPYEAYAGSKPAGSVDKLGVERLRAILAGKAEATLKDVLARDLAQAALNSEVVTVERAIRYKRDLFEILQNFVSFSRFYARQPAVFQAGTLFLDGRACGLCMDVSDAGKHAALAGMAGAYLAYCDLTRPGGEKRSIVAAFTGGDNDNLFVGRNGVFYDRKGRDWDATISKIVSNPVSVRAAFWAPYKKLASLIEEQAAKRATDAGAKSDELIAAGATLATTADKAPAPPAAKKIDVGTVAAIGVAVGGVGAMVVGIMSAFFGLGLWMPLGLLGLVLAVSAPSMLLAWLKLRKRNLGPILDANGWAINGRARINVPFGGALTELARLPRGAERALNDPFAEKQRPWWLYVTLAVVGVLGVSWYMGKLDGLLPKAVRSVTVLGESAPAAKAPAPAPAP